MMPMAQGVISGQPPIRISLARRPYNAGPTVRAQNRNERKPAINRQGGIDRRHGARAASGNAAVAADLNIDYFVGFQLDWHVIRFGILNRHAKIYHEG
jgi:hypothetical protein